MWTPHSLFQNPDMKPCKRNEASRRRRHLRVRRKVIGTPDRPRLCVHRSQKHVYCQVIDDLEGRTLAAASTLTPAVREQTEKGATVSAAAIVGKVIAERARRQRIERVCFDRGGYDYHGRVKALAEGAREGGLQF